MSSLRNALKRREHRERSQPSYRKGLGLLEKKKDYVLRAKDYHKKENTLKRLRAKAEARNPDEFYFAMENAKTTGGVHKVEEGQKYGHEEVLAMKTQDVKYLATKAITDEKKAERMKASLHFLGIQRPKNHTVFVEDETELAAFDAAEHFDTPAELLDRSFNRPRKAALEDANFLPDPEATEAAVERSERQRAHSYKLLQDRLTRKGKLSKVAAHVEYQKTLMGKGRKRKLSAKESGVEGQKVFKWFKERKK